jgi:hypothetical protein
MFYFLENISLSDLTSSPFGKFYAAINMSGRGTLSWAG